MTKQNFHTELSGDLPDLNLFRISTECSEPRRVIMLTTGPAFRRRKMKSFDFTACTLTPPGQL